MKATGIVRRIDDLGRVVIPKEIRRTMRIREGDPLEIYTTREGEVIFKKYSLLGGLEDFAAQFCDALNRTSGFTAAVTDRDAVIAITGAGKRELLGKSLSEALSRTSPCPSPTETTATPPPWPRPFSAKATCWAWCCSCRRRARSPARGSISWPRPCPPFWESTWNRENRPPEALPPAVLFQDFSQKDTVSSILKRSWP